MSEEGEGVLVTKRLQIWDIHQHHLVTLVEDDEAIKPQRPLQGAKHLRISLNASEVVVGATDMMLIR